MKFVIYPQNLYLHWFLSLAFVSSSFSHAAESTTSLTLPTTNTLNIETIKSDKAVPQFEENEEITDAKLRADAGSLNKYSLRSSFVFLGPPLDDLSSSQQPNPDRLVGVFDTSLSGSLSLQYRLSKRTSFVVGSGVSAITPLHGIKRYDIRNPFFSYDFSQRISGYQLRNSVGFQVTTVPIFVKTGQAGGLNWNGSLVKDLGQSRFAFQLDASANYFIFNRDYRPEDKRISRYIFSAFPQIKYNFTDRTNINTSIAYSFNNFRSNEDTFALTQRLITQRLTLGHAFTRDIFVAPYISFFPSDPQLSLATLNLSTSINL